MIHDRFSVDLAVPGAENVALRKFRATTLQCLQLPPETPLDAVRKRILAITPPPTPTPFQIAAHMISGAAAAMGWLTALLF